MHITECVPDLAVLVTVSVEERNEDKHQRIIASAALQPAMHRQGVQSMTGVGVERGSASAGLHDDSALDPEEP